MFNMAKIKRKITVCICIGFLILFSFTAWGITKWETEDLRSSMYNDFMNAYHLLFTVSYMDDNFSDHSQSYLSELSTKLAQSDIYAAAVILNEHGDILLKSDVSNISFNVRPANAVDLKRFGDCIRDAQEGVNNEQFPRGKMGGSIGSSGPYGYTQGWTLSDNNGDIRYLFINAKFFEDEAAVKSMIPRYAQIFILMGVICFFLCFIISKIVGKEISREPKEVIDTLTSNEQ